MEKIINYKIKDFLKLDIEKVTEYLIYLELLNPATKISNPNATKKNKEPETIQVKEIRFLTFGQVQVLRINFENGDDESVFENISVVTGLSIQEIHELSIIEFYGVIANLKKQLIDLANMEENALGDGDNEDDSDILYLSVNASQRMAKFGILNTINHIAANDVTKWQAIQDLSYMTIFNWLVMNKTNKDIEREVSQLQRQKQQHN